MSDAFADLWNSSAPSKPSQPQTLGSHTPSNAPKRQQPDVFALLSSTSSSPNPQSRPGTGFSQPQKPTSSTTPKPAVTNNSGDAFSGLFTSSSSSMNSNLTIAQRAAEAERQKLEALRKHQHAQQEAKSQGSSAWDGLDSLMSSSSRPAATAASRSHDDDFGFEAFAQPTPVKPHAPPKANSPFDDDDLLGDFGAATKQSSAAVPVQKSRSQGWDSPPPPHTRADSPGDFDFGDRENRDSLLNDSSGEEDDILGALSKPVESIPKRRPPSTDTNAHTTSPPPRPTPGPRPESSSRPVSPPPHIIGQIVEMGFSVQQARVALASTDTGLDVQAALEALLSNGAASSSSRRQTPQPRTQSPDYPSSGQPPRSATHLMTGGQARNTPSPANRNDGERNLQEQADKIMAQASEIGLNMFTKASAFWKEGKERVQKAYVERATSSGTATPSGRPKWMQEAREDDGWEDNDSPMKSAFADEPTSRPAAAQARSAPPSKPKQPELPPQEQQGRASRIANLFGDDEPAAYVSPYRRGKPKEQAPAPAAATPMSAPKPPPAVPARPAPPKPRLNVVSCSSSTLARATQYKTRGTEQFKLGQYADAASSYSLAITALPEGHLSLVPLYNNRALARLKTGEYAGAIEDATAVISLIGEGYHPAREAKVEKEDEGAGIDLGDGIVKAMKRRAEANEGRERWKDAEKDWEALSRLEFAPGGIKGEAVKNAGRCRRTIASLQEKAAAPSAPPPAVKPKAAPPRTRPAVPAKPSQALKDLRTANEAAEAEDQQRHELKDSVDAKLTAWKGGKEGNIRALLGSVDTVLWPELGFKKVGMAELVTPAQVKIRYTRVIARLHPDKLTPNNTTVEQRMIANAVFGALNEAWNSFKQ